jgi:hypothetical protein
MNKAQRRKMDLTLTEFPVKDGTVKMRLSQLPGRNGKIWRGIDIRKFFTDENGQYVPTKKGITIPLDLWPRFLQAIEEVSKHLPPCKAA